MDANDYVLVRGIRDTRSTLGTWQRQPWPVVRVWFFSSVGIAAALLVTVWLVAQGVAADPTPIAIFGINSDAGYDDVIAVLGRNSLVLALHATACVAGFIAGASIPIAAAQRSGFSRWFHEKAGQFAIVFVSAVTLFSLITQALILGFKGSTIAAQLEISPGALIATVLPHALLELTAVFLPLAAWLAASKRGDWDQLLAATFATVALAIPALVVAALIEVYFWPQVLIAVGATG